MAFADETASKYVRKSNSDTVIVFVHGFMGDAVNTWTSESAYWPKLLTEDHAFDGTDVFVYSYHTGLSATLSIDELAENMRAVLSVNGVNIYNKIIFISYSMGGLVTRAYLLKNREVADHTYFAYFLSTPTTGSQIASIVKLVSQNAQIVKLNSMNAEDYLADLMRQWLAAGFKFPSYCAYEKRATYGVFLVVNMGSAAALCTKPLDPIDADHIEIAKPKSELSTSYISFKAAYADAKIPDLNKLNRKSTLIQSEVKEVKLFPNKTDKLNAKTLLEEMLKDKAPNMLFDVLGNYRVSEIEGMNVGGVNLLDYKKAYYAYQSNEVDLEQTMMKKIGGMVSVTFSQAWAIYLRYAMLRFSGMSMDDIKAGGNFLNFGIT